MVGDRRTSWSPLGTVCVIAGLTLASALAHAGLRFRAAITLAWLTQAIVLDLRTRVYDKLQRLSFRFFDANQSGSIINRVAGDVQSVRMFVDGVIIQVITVVLSLAVYLAYMLSVHVSLTLACLATTPLLWVAGVWFSRSVKPAYLENSRLTDQVVLTLAENMQGVQVVKGFGREAEEIAKFAAANRAVKDQKCTIFHRVALFQPAMGFLTQLNMVVLLGYGGYLVVRGELQPGGRAVRVCQPAAAVCQPGGPDHEHRQQHPEQPDGGRTRVRNARRAVGSAQPGAPGASEAHSRRGAV